MSSSKYESGKLNSILESLFKKNSSGILSLKTQVTHWQSQKNCILLFYDGALVYGELNVTKIPSSKEICQTLGQKFNPNSSNAAMAVALERATNPNSIQELMAILVTMKIFNWQQVEDYITHQIIIILEQFLSNPGQAKWQKNSEFNLQYGTERKGLNWSKIEDTIKQRKQKWDLYAPTIPAMDSIPSIDAQQLTTIKDDNVRRHLISSANGINTLLDIAEKMGKDPLKIAKSYFTWANNDWVNFVTTPQSKVDSILEVNKSKNQSIKNQLKSPESVSKDSVEPVAEPTAKTKLPIVLSVDDSAIIQISIKRALQEHYQVLLATKAADALEILNENSVELMLLDLTMPDIDGLEFCKIVRKMDKFQDLPIVMVTARDGFVNKMKGQIAGSSRYLTKPFKPEQLREVVGEYIK